MKFSCVLLFLSSSASVLFCVFLPHGLNNAVGVNEVTKEEKRKSIEREKREKRKQNSKDCKQTKPNPIFFPISRRKKGTKRLEVRTSDKETTKECEEEK